jgi:endo-1,3(4)-beta-glucanase
MKTGTQELYRMRHLMRIYLFVFIAIAGLSADIDSQIVGVGAGSYTTQFPGTDAAGRNGYPSGTPYLSGQAATKPVPTNDWWSNLIKEAHGGQAFNYPLSYRSYSRGVAVNYTMPFASGFSEYRAPMDGVYDGIIVGVENLNASSSTASDHSDWTATINWNDGAHDFSALMGHGMPFTYFIKGDTDVARIEIGYNEAGAYVDGNKVIIEDNYRGASYIAYGPSGSTWTISNNVFTSTLNGQNYWSLVMVPHEMDIADAITFFEEYAYVFPTETRVAWNYDESTSIVTTEYIISPTIMEGADTTVFWGILPHHWGNLASGSAQPDTLSYNTVRGELKVLKSNTFSTELRFSGILPTLPNLGKYSSGFDPAELYDIVKRLKSLGLAEWTDSYNQGQEMNLLIQTARVADQIGYIEARNEILETVKERLEDWLTAEAGEVAFLFYYNDDWDALIGYPAGHRQDVNLNDHHFHWGYFIHAAAFLEQYQKGWANQWGEMINMLIRDAANPSRTDDMFPFLRNYSPYAGHSWANGFATEPFGNDQESTSESMQFNSALIHWGTITGNDSIRDLGIFLYTNEHASVNEYWFDQNNRTFQPEYGYEMVARIWGGGYDNGTWWTTDVAASYGIQLYPIHGGSLYLGHNTDYVQEAWNGMSTNTDVLSNVPNDNLWYDTYWKFLSFLDADEALSLYNNYRERNIKFGTSDAQTYHWLHSMVALGQVSEEITADYPIAAAFSNEGQMTYAAHNYGSDTITVHFSDGYNLVVPAFSRATSRDIEASITIEASDSVAAVGGSITLTAEVSGTVSKVEFYSNGILIATDETAPYSAIAESLEAGFPGFYAKAYEGVGFNLSNIVSVQVGTQQPYSGTAHAIPGTIEPGDYDVFPGASGQGITYFDVTSWNEGGYRPDEAVDAAAAGGEGATIGWIEAGEWLEFTVNVEDTADYNLSFRYASDISSGGGPFHFLLNNEKITNDITVANTGGWNSWRTKEVNSITLPKGEHILKVQFDQGGFNLGRITFTDPSTSTLTNAASDFLQVYPNPVSDFVTVSLSYEGGLILIRDITGKILDEIIVSTTSHTIDMQSYQAGIYFIAVFSHGNVNTTRIIKR